MNVVNTSVGGSFGGKIFWQLERNQDKQVAGIRNGIDFDYDAYFDAIGKFGSCDLTLITGTTSIFYEHGC